MVLKISEIAKEIDRDGDGKVSKAELAILNTLKEMDVDGDGEIEIGELLSLGNQMNKKEVEVRNMRKMLFAVLISSVLFCACTFALSWAASEAAKDFKPTKGGEFKTTDNEPATISLTEQVGSVYDLPTHGPDGINGIKTIQLSIGKREYNWVISSIEWVSYTELYAFSANGDVIHIVNGTGINVTRRHDGSVLKQPYDEEEQTAHRKLLEMDHADQRKLLSLPICNSMPVEERVVGVTCKGAPRNRIFGNQRLCWFGHFWKKPCWGCRAGSHIITPNSEGRYSRYKADQLWTQQCPPKLSTMGGGSGGGWR